MKIRQTLCALALPVVMGCASTSDRAEPVDADGLVSNQTAPPATGPDALAAIADVPSAPDAEIRSETDSGGTLVYYDEARGALRGSAKEPTFRSRTLQLNFIDVPAAEVARIVVREALGETLAIADGISAAITLTSAEPVPTQAALEALESVLAASDLALVRQPSGFLLTTLAKAREMSQASGTSKIGFGTSMVTVKHLAPSKILSLVNPFLGTNVAVTSDESLGLITITGPKSDVAQTEAVIRQFDVPTLVDRVYGMFVVRYTEVAGLRTEIESLMTAKYPDAVNSIQLIELPRLNRLFVVTRNRQMFGEIERLVADFDQPSGGDERRLRYYVARNSPASVLSQQLRAAFGIAGSGGAGSTFPVEPDAGRGQAFDTRSLPAAGSGFNAPDGFSVVPDELNNALIIRATDAEYQELLLLIRRMDVLPPQVLIEATIAEVTLTNDLNYGIRWFFESGDFDVAFSDDASGAVNRAFPGIGLLYQDGLSARAALDALSSVTDVTVLSAPSIMVQNNQNANLQVGDEVPILTQQATSTSDPNAPIVSTIQLRETGVILDVKPRINASDVVVLEISQEVSEAVSTVTAGINSPTIRQRQFSSTVAVQNNGTVALGGLIRTSMTDNETGIPGLSKAPLVGSLFKSRTQNTRRTELIIFLTPRIVRNSQDADDIMLYLRQKLQGLHTRIEK